MWLPLILVHIFPQRIGGKRSLLFNLQPSRTWSYHMSIQDQAARIVRNLRQFLPPPALPGLALECVLPKRAICSQRTRTPKCQNVLRRRHSLENVTEIKVGHLAHDDWQVRSKLRGKTTRGERGGESRIATAP